MKFENQGYIQTFKPAYTLYQSHTICAETPGVQASFIPLHPSHVLRPSYTLVKLLGVDQVWYWERQVPGWEVEKLDWSGKISRGRWQRAKVEGRACQVRGEGSKAGETQAEALRWESEQSALLHGHRAARSSRRGNWRDGSVGKGSYHKA